jgi:hypothetical protein
MRAEEIINKEYRGHKNFVTPTTIRCGMARPDVAYELSVGDPIFTSESKKIYGVSLVRYDYDTRRTTALYDESKAFFSLEEAVEYIIDYGKGVQHESHSS